jgi:ligand-binding SRPBCC domain-containing protein
MLRLRYSVWIDAPVEKVWAFHERDDIFELLAPAHSGFRLIARKGKLRTGSRVEMSIPFGPFRFRWLALHVDHEQGRFFTDEQIRGPFRRWFHKHCFEEENGGTRLTEKIECSLPLGPVSDWLLGWLVRLRLKSEFARRHELTKRICEQAA